MRREEFEENGEAYQLIKFAADGQVVLAFVAVTGADTDVDQILAVGVDGLVLALDTTDAPLVGCTQVVITIIGVGVVVVVVGFAVGVAVVVVVI